MYYRSNPGNMCQQFTADYTGATRQHELDHARTGIDLPCLTDLGHELQWEQIIQIIQIICPRCRLIVHGDCVRKISLLGEAHVYRSLCSVGTPQKLDAYTHLSQRGIALKRVRTQGCGAASRQAVEVCHQIDGQGVITTMMLMTMMKFSHWLTRFPPSEF